MFAAHFGWIVEVNECNRLIMNVIQSILFRINEWKTITKDVKYKIEKLK